MSRAAAHHPWPDLPDLSNDDLDAVPMSWDAITTYVLVTMTAIATMAVVLGLMAYAMGMLL